MLLVRFRRRGGCWPCCRCLVTLAADLRQQESGWRGASAEAADGLMCADDKRLASSEMTAESRVLAAQMLRAPLNRFSETPWAKAQGADLRKFLIQTLQRNIEKKLITASMLDKI